MKRYNIKYEIAFTSGDIKHGQFTTHGVSTESAAIAQFWRNLDILHGDNCRNVRGIMLTEITEQIGF
jgi:hypothetical protein